MPPKKATAAPIAKGQSSLSTFFSNGKGAVADSSKVKGETPSPTKLASNGDPKDKPDPVQTSPSSKSKYFPSHRASSGSRGTPMVIDDSDDDNDNDDFQPEPATTKRSPRKSAFKRKTYDQDDEDDEDDFVPPPKKVATAPKPKPEPKRAAAAKAIDLDSDDNDEFVKPAPRSADVAPTKPVTPKEQIKTEAAPPPATDKKAAWRDMAAKRAAGPSDPGSKEIPTGQPNCLAGLTLVFTGELSSISREDAVELAKRYGARVTGAPSSKTSYVVLGEGAGPKKLELIEKNRLKTLQEDEYLDLIRTRGAGAIDEKTKQKMRDEEKKIQQVAKELAAPPKGANVDPISLDSMLWTSKYAPKNIKELVGNKAAVEKLATWLKAWPSSYKSNFKKPGPVGMNIYRAVLISGPPGIGKTTSAHLVAKMEGYSPLEFNASDARSKKLIESMLMDTINNKSLDSWYSGSGKLDAGVGPDGVRIHDRTVLIMDEVDGMSGGDRGGVGAINALIKKTKVPIICICNDRKNQKMRPFDHTTFNLTFRKPEVAQIKSRMLSIAYREKMQVQGEVMGQLIEASQGDIRSVINMLSTWRLSKSSMDFDESRALGAENAKPGMHTPFSLYSELSSPSMFNATSRKTLNDKSDLYFQDHAIVPLMVAENYVKARPVRASREPNDKLKTYKHLELLKKASESISDGDIVDRMIHGSEMHWSLMPLHGMVSTVRPCSYIYGGTEGGFPSFPSWLGQNSKQQRLLRAVVDLQAKMRLVCSGSRHDLRQHYLPSMWSMLIHPLVKRGAEGVDDVIELMDDYYLGVEDREAILELGVEPHNAEYLGKSIPSTVKAGFTRKYNAGSHPIAFNKASDFAGKLSKTVKQAAPDLEDAVEEESVPVNDEDEDEDDKGDDVSKDKLVKKPKPSAATAAGKGKAKAKAKK